MTNRVMGSVNWFDSKKGFGFITVVTPDTENTGKDIFVHFSNVSAQENNYKRLYPGEYVEFEIRETSDKRGPSCFEVTGPFGGRLLTDNENHRYKVYPKQVRNNSNDTVEENEVEEGKVEEGEVEEGEVEESEN